MLKTGWRYSRETKFVFFLTITLVFLISLPLEAIEWKEAKSEHFIVRYTGSKKFADDVSRKSEAYYRRIAAQLGYDRFSEFWTWDKRVRIYLYPTQKEFLGATNQPAWSYGMADYQAKEISSFEGSAEFLDSILPHEMGHLIFRDYVGFKGEVPLWLDEGVAQWVEEGKRQRVRQMVSEYFDKDILMSLKSLMTLDVRKLALKERIQLGTIRTKDGKSAILLLSGDNLVNTFYLQSAALVDFMIERYGTFKFIEFCRRLREGSSLESALKYSYTMYLSSLQDLEDKWREHLARQN